ncbi:MAG: radical SAM protein [Proteobacteria bacterium]|nr:radical SAM protein [Pseudomonadota bacterium]
MSTSNYKADAELAKSLLDNVSPTMCLAKWNQVSLHLPTGLTNSCYHPPLHEIDATKLENNPASLHNTAEKLNQRQQMLKGERPEGCSYCWKMEDTGEMSDRHYRSGEPWAMQDFTAIKQNPMDERWTPRYVEVNFNNACNLKCSYCSPQFSTTWGKEIAVYGQYPTSPPHNAPEHFQGRKRPIPNREDNPYVTAFWKWWPTLYKNLKHFRMTGGEPMMDNNTYKVFQYVIDNPKEDLHLNVTSNMCPPNNKLKNKYFDMVKKICIEEKVEHFMQFVSVDAWGKKAEYIRNGLNFNYMMDNVDEFLDRIPVRNSVTFIITYNNLSVTSLDKLLESILELRKRHSKTYQRVWFDIPLLRQPAWQQITLLPESYQAIHEANIEYMRKNSGEEKGLHIFKDFEIQKMLRNLAYWRKNADASTQNKKNFYAFFNEHDRRRLTNFETIFPEMEEFWTECKNI